MGLPIFMAVVATCAIIIVLAFVKYDEKQSSTQKP